MAVGVQHINWKLKRLNGRKFNEWGKLKDRDLSCFYKVLPETVMSSSFWQKIKPSWGDFTAAVSAQQCVKKKKKDGARWRHNNFENKELFLVNFFTGQSVFSLVIVSQPDSLLFMYYCTLAKRQYEKQNSKEKHLHCLQDDCFFFQSYYFSEGNVVLMFPTTGLWLTVRDGEDGRFTSVNNHFCDLVAVNRIIIS